MNKKNAPKHNNVKYVNRVPYLTFEYKPIKIWKETHEVGSRKTGLLHMTFVYRPTLNLTANKRRIISEFFKDFDRGFNLLPRLC